MKERVRLSLRVRVRMRVMESERVGFRVRAG